MVRIGLIGDTQGRFRVPDLLAKVAPHFKTLDEIWHVGDWQYEEVLKGLRALGPPLRVVNGNAPDDPRFPERYAATVEGLAVGMVHRPPQPADVWAAELDICIHGHTHRWRDEVKGGTRFINASTPTAAGFSADRTIAVLAISGRAADLQRIQLA